MKRAAGFVIAMGLGAASGAAADDRLRTQGEFTQSAYALMDAAFAPQRTVTDPDPIQTLIDQEAYVAGQGPVRWRTSETPLAVSGGGAVVDSLRISVGGPLRGPGGLPLNPERAEFDAQAYEVTMVRNWPRAMQFAAAGYDVDVTPHAGLGFGAGGGQAEAGAQLRLGQRLDDEVEDRLNAMGVRDGQAFGQTGRWYVFAAASGRAVGLNMLRNGGEWDPAGWSTDRSSALIGDAHVGVGWRKGPVQAALGYVHREVKGQHMIWGQETRNDQIFALSFAIKPQN
ncbi:lipid A-modifier LpxR family protein [Phenylobacterium sp.]|uniref:lipid A-modifier LpxR family protein n=1 Tax=Phenylobacterium sp. TaxID=1871053 RepID=UPI0027303D74|nr:lipid A-modifier LpxR family protein [Phenylobacterium sp.]MDP2215402.1 DUF2219 family protein [Phenylobacterium sp.]